jgi:hypothetical protein
MFTEAISGTSSPRSQFRFWNTFRPSLRLKLGNLASKSGIDLFGVIKASKHYMSICPDQDRLVYVLSRISNIRFVMGCVIEPGFDDQGVVQNFLLEFNGRLNGLLFIYDSVVDCDRKPLVGPLCGE